LLEFSLSVQIEYTLPSGKNAYLCNGLAAFCCNLFTIYSYSYRYCGSLRIFKYHKIITFNNFAIVWDKSIKNMFISVWKEISRNTNFIDYDLESHPLQIKTNSTVGSYETITVVFYSSTYNYIGGIYISFRDPPMYTIYSCADFTPFFLPGDKDKDKDKIWTFTKTDAALKMNCNGEDVLNYVFLESDYEECASSWSQDVIR